MDIRKKSETISLQKLREKLKDGSYVVNSFLLAQIGKNYNISDKNMITGNEIISLAHELLLIVKKNHKYKIFMVRM